MKFIYIIALIAITSCSTYEVEWKHHAALGTIPEPLKPSMEECDKIARAQKHSFKGGVDKRVINIHTYKSCMQNKGWLATR